MIRKDNNSNNKSKTGLDISLRLFGREFNLDIGFDSRKLENNTTPTTNKIPLIYKGMSKYVNKAVDEVNSLLKNTAEEIKRYQATQTQPNNKDKNNDGGQGEVNGDFDGNGANVDVDDGDVGNIKETSDEISGDKSKGQPNNSDINESAAEQPDDNEQDTFDLIDKLKDLTDFMGKCVEECVDKVSDKDTKTNIRNTYEKIRDKVRDKVSPKIPTASQEQSSDGIQSNKDNNLTTPPKSTSTTEMGVSDISFDDEDGKSVTGLSSDVGKVLNNADIVETDEEGIQVKVGVDKWDY